MSDSKKGVISQIKKSSLVNSARYARGLGYAISAGKPADSLFLIGVTGTDGKTTTCNLIYHILKTNGVKVGLISTISLKYWDGTKEYEKDTGLHVTSPDSVDVHSYFAMMKKAGVTHAVVECTSHALVQERYAGINFDIGVVTNITHEHLDYHGTYEKYVMAKALLFRRDNNFLVKDRGRGIAIINHDDKCWDYLRPYTEQWERIGYGFSDFSDFHILDFEQAVDGLSFKLVRESDTGEVLESHVIRASLLGEYNASNISAAVIAAFRSGVGWSGIESAVASFKQLTGRFERIAEPSAQHGDIIVDFAHTPNALQNLLRLARQITKGKVIVVFGCASERDIQKRPMMGAIAGQLADITILTAEDPRFESVEDINKQIAVGLRESGAEEYPSASLPELAEQSSREALGEHFPLYMSVSDRRKAIITAVALSETRDIVLICGKGHEKSMNLLGEEIAWSDQEVAKEAVNLVG